MSDLTEAKLQQFKSQSLWASLPLNLQDQILPLAKRDRFTLQEFKIFVDQCIDFHSWQGKSLIDIWHQWTPDKGIANKPDKKLMFKRMNLFMDQKKGESINYNLAAPQFRPRPSAPVKQVKSDSQQKIFGMCPVQSEKTLCCNLRTIDAVKNCGFGCSYCSIQTMFNDKNIQFDEEFAAKIAAIDIDSKRFYHIGTGQSSDSLLWGNRFSILDSLMKFANEHPNILLEFKTKSKNIGYFLDKPLPKNLVCSWSLNPQKVVINEEHRTASEDERIASARQLADLGIKIAFHFHPIVHYEGWESDYSNLIQRVLTEFRSDEVLFISFGTLSFSKAIVKTIRSQGIPSKMLQTPMVPNPEGKMTYPEDIKKRLFSVVYEKFKPWHQDLFFYLCMEESKYWLSTFGRAYASNEEFESAFEMHIRKKLPKYFL